MSAPHRFVVALLVLAATACRGPQAPLEVGVREFGTDVVLGGETGDDAPPPPPLPPAAVVVNVPVVGPPPAPPPPPPPPTQSNSPTPTDSPSDRPSPTEPPSPSESPSPTPTRTRTESPSPSPSPSPTPTVFECDELDTTLPAELPIETRITAPPAEALYAYRNHGGYSVSGANASEGRFPRDSTRAVQAVTHNEDGSFTYEVLAELAGTLTTTTYQVIPRSDIPGQAGMYIVSVVTQGPGPEPTEGRFQPVVPMKLLEFPAFETTTYTVAGTDPLEATTMSYTATIGKTVRINACGEPVDGIVVKLTDGRIDGPLTNVEFTATYVIATQYGGLMIRDAFVLAGREGVDTVSRDNLAVINEVPLPSPPPE